VVKPDESVASMAERKDSMLKETDSDELKEDLTEVQVKVGDETKTLKLKEGDDVSAVVRELSESNGMNKKQRAKLRKTIEAELKKAMEAK
jgi:transcriptional regulator of NAD metabolism